MKMEIRMVKCPKCQSVYNEALNMGCPQCSGGVSRGAGFSKTVMPGVGVQNPVQPTSPPVNSFVGATMPPPVAAPGHSGSGSFSRTAPPSFAGAVNPQSTVVGSGFSRTAPPSFAGTVNPQGVAGGSSFSKTAPPADGRFVHTQYIGENVTVKAEMRVAGWIVQIDGPRIGKEFRIHSGYNYIGREEGDIRIEGDDYISAAKDSQIYYDAVSAAFYISHVNGANAVRVNEEPVVSGSAKLKAYDILTIGRTKFVFVPLCGDQFKWEDQV